MLFYLFHDEAAKIILIPLFLNACIKFDRNMT